jgi:hypothetical protein
MPPRAIVAGPDNPSGGRRRWKSVRERGVILARIGRACRDVNDGSNLGIDAGFGDDHAAERMRHQHGRPLLQSQDLLRRLDTCL